MAEKGKCYITVHDEDKVMKLKVEYELESKTLKRILTVIKKLVVK